MKSKKEKKYTLRICPKCKSKKVAIVVGGNGKIWECKSCKFKGPSFPEKEVGEDEFLDSFEDNDNLTKIFMNKEMPGSVKPKE